jgi:hypothetical protein
MTSLGTPQPGLQAVATVLALSLAACSGPKPILYPNAHFQAVGAEAAERDIAECRKMAEEAGATPDKGTSARVAGSTAVGAGIGAAGGAVGGAIVGAGRHWRGHRRCFWSNLVPPQRPLQPFATEPDASAVRGPLPEGAGL